MDERTTDGAKWAELAADVAAVQHRLARVEQSIEQLHQRVGLTTRAGEASANTNTSISAGSTEGTNPAIAPATSVGALTSPPTSPSDAASPARAELVSAARGEPRGPGGERGALVSQRGTRAVPRGGPAAGSAGGLKTRSAVDLEQLVGGRWFAVAGALAMVIFLGLFFRLALDRGWLVMLSGTTRCVLGAGLGVGLIVLGERERRRLGDWASVGLSSAGVAALYLSVLAAHSLYDLIGAGTAMGLLVASAALGVAIAARSRLALVAVVSLVGGYLAPVLVGQADRPMPALPVYLVVLLMVGQGLMAWRRGSFWLAALTGWVGTGTLGFFWVWSNAGNEPLARLGFVSSVWAVMHAGLWFAGRERTSVTPAGEGEPSSADAGRAAVGLSAAAPAFSLLSTLWALLLAMGVLNRSGLAPTWMAPLAGCGVSLLLAVWWCGWMRVLVDEARTLREKLGAGLLVQSMGMLTLAVGLATSGQATALSWGLMGASAAIGGWWVRSRRLAAYGVVLSALGSVRLIFLGAMWVRNTTTVEPWGLGLVVTTWTGLALAAAGLWWSVALAAGSARWENPGRSGRAMRACGAASAAAGMIFAMSSVALPGAEAMTVIVAWLVLGAASAWLSRRRPALCLDLWGSLAIGLAGWAWVVVAALAPAGRLLEQPGAPGTVPAFWVGLAGAGALLFASARARADRGGGALALAALILGVMWAWVDSSMEVARAAAWWSEQRTAQLAAVSIWWAVLGTGLVLAGFARRRAPLRHGGLALMMLAAVKVVFIDLGGVSAGWRVASFGLLGVLMLGVAGVYARLAQRNRGEGSASDTANAGR